MEQTPRYGHSPVIMKKVSSFGDIDNAGDFTWEIRDGARYIVVALPLGLLAEQYLIDNRPVAEGSGTRARQWGWDVHEDAPVVDPSIQYPRHWHRPVQTGKLGEA